MVTKAALAALVFWLVLAVSLVAEQQRFVVVHDPNGNRLIINVKAVAKIRPHPQGGTVIYLGGGVGGQHVKESIETVLEMLGATR